MRLCVALALVSIFAGSAAFAAEGAKGKAKKGKKRSKPNTPVETLDGVDPIGKERSDGGRYMPTGLTGKLKARQEQQLYEEEVARRPKKKYVPPPRDRFIAFGDVVLGLGRAPRPAPAVDGMTTHALVISAYLGARYDFSPKLTGGIRVPWSTASMELAGSTKTEQEFALGSPQIWGEYRLSPSLVTTVPIFFGIGIPLAQGDSDPNTLDEIGRRRATVNLLADAAHGWRDGELFGVKRLPVMAGIGVQYQAPALVIRAYDKLVAGIDIGPALLPTAYVDGKLVANRVSLRNVLFAGATYDLLAKPVTIWAGLDAWMAYSAVEAADFESSATDPSPIQFVIEPRVGVNIKKLRPSFGFVFPMGGQLSESEMTAFRLHVDYAF